MSSGAAITLHEARNETATLAVERLSLNSAIVCLQSLCDGSTSDQSSPQRARCTLFAAPFHRRSFIQRHRLSLRQIVDKAG